MAQYIDKAALVAEIERLYKKWEMGNYVHEKLISFLDTFEVKEVDLEQAYKSYMKSRKDDISGNTVTVNMKDLAHHFFELGMQQSKNDNNNEEKK